MNKFLISITLLLISFSASAINKPVQMVYVPGCTGNGTSADISMFQQQANAVRFANSTEMVKYYSSIPQENKLFTVIPLIGHTVTTWSQAEAFYNQFFSGYSCIQFNRLGSVNDVYTGGTGRTIFWGDNRFFTRKMTANELSRVSQSYLANGYHFPGPTQGFDGALDTVNAPLLEHYAGDYESYMKTIHGNVMYSNLVNDLLSESSDSVWPISFSTEYLNNQISLKSLGASMARYAKNNIDSNGITVYGAPLGMRQGDGEFDDLEMSAAMDEGIIPVWPMGNRGDKDAYLRAKSGVAPDDWKGRTRYGVGVQYGFRELDGKISIDSPGSYTDGREEAMFIYIETGNELIPRGADGTLTMETFNDGAVSQGAHVGSSLATEKLTQMFDKALNYADAEIKAVISAGLMTKRQMVETVIDSFCITAHQVNILDLYVPEIDVNVLPACGIPDLEAAKVHLKQRLIDVLHPPGQYANQTGHYDIEYTYCPNYLRSFSNVTNKTVAEFVAHVESRNCPANYSNPHLVFLTPTKHLICFERQNTSVLTACWYPNVENLNAIRIEEYLPAP